MAALSVQQVALAGLSPTYSSATATTGDTVPCGDRNFVHVKNGSGSSITVTIATPLTISGLAVADVSVTVSAGGAQFIGPLTPASLLGNTAGQATVVCSAVTTVTLAALRV